MVSTHCNTLRAFTSGFVLKHNAEFMNTGENYRTMDSKPPHSLGRNLHDSSHNYESRKMNLI